MTTNLPEDRITDTGRTPLDRPPSLMPVAPFGPAPEPPFRTEPEEYRARHQPPEGGLVVDSRSSAPVRSALAHLLRTAVQSLEARAAAADVAAGEASPSGAPVAGRLGIRVTSASGVGPLVVRDDGIGLSAPQVRRLLADPELDAAPTGLSVDDLVQMESVSAVLRACLRVADVVELRSLSALDPEAPTMRAVARRDGTVRVSASGEPLASPGTEVRLHLDPDHRGHVVEEHAAALVRDLAEQLPVEVVLDGRTIDLPGPVWDLDADERHAWCAGRLGDEPLAVLDLGVGPHGTQVLAVVPPHPVPATRARGHRVFVDGVLLPDGRARLVPPWASFCTVVLEAGLLPLTPAGDALATGAALDAVAEHVARGLLVQLVLLADLEPEQFRAMAEVHHEALLAAALEHPDVMDLVRGVVPLPTTLGEMTLDDLARVRGLVPYAGSDTWSLVQGTAERDRVLVVDARRSGVARFIERLGEDGPTFAELRPGDLAGFGISRDAA